MRNTGIGSFAIPAICSGLLFSGLALAQSENAVEDNDWQFSATPYLWGADIKGSTGSGGDIDVSFDDIFSNLEAALMLTFEARKGK